MQCINKYGNRNDALTTLCMYVSMHNCASACADLVQCGLVCRRWNSLAEDDYLWLRHCKSLLRLLTKQKVLTWYVFAVHGHLRVEYRDNHLQCKLASYVNQHDHKLAT